MKEWIKKNIKIGQEWYEKKKKERDFKKKLKGFFKDIKKRKKQQEKQGKK